MSQTQSSNAGAAQYGNKLFRSKVGKFADEKIHRILQNAAQILSRSKIAGINESFAQSENFKKKGFNVEIPDLFAGAVEVRCWNWAHCHAIERYRDTRLPRKDLDGEAKNLSWQQNGIKPFPQRR